MIVPRRIAAIAGAPAHPGGANPSVEPHASHTVRHARTVTVSQRSNLYDELPQMPMMTLSALSICFAAAVTLS